jgi:ribose transport system substrate-binding protein
MNPTKTGLITLVAALALSTAGCNRGPSGEAGGGAAAGKSMTLALSTLDNPFFIDVRDGAQDAAKAAGVNLVVVDARNDPATQAKQVADAITASPVAVLINPVDSDAAGAAVMPALAAKIPVVTLDRAVNDAEVTSAVSSDNVDGGWQAAKAIAEAIGGKGDILILEGVPGTSASRDRGKGFSAGLKVFPGLKVVGRKPADFDRTKGFNVATELLQSHPGVVAIFAENDEMALGAVQALGSKAGQQVKVFGFDGTQDGLKAVKAGTMVGSIAQQPKNLGKTAVNIAIKAVNGEAVEKNVPVPVTTVTIANVDRFLQ